MDKIRNAANKLKAVEAYANEDEGFASGNTALNEDVFGRAPNDPAWSVSLTTYNLAIQSILDGLDDDQRALALQRAGVDYDDA